MGKISEQFVLVRHHSYSDYSILVKFTDFLRYSAHQKPTPPPPNIILRLCKIQKISSLWHPCELIKSEEPKRLLINFLLALFIEKHNFIFAEEQKGILAEAKTVQEKATKKAKDLEEKMKNASAVRERELKEAQKEITASKKKMEASSKKAREMVQVRVVAHPFSQAWLKGKWNFGDVL